MPETQRTIEEQAARNRRGQQLLDRRRAYIGDPLAKFLLWIIDDHVGPNASFTLTFAELASEMEVDVTTVYRKAAKLKGQGLIDYVETASGSSVYEFRISRPNVAELAEESGQVPPRRPRGRPKSGPEKIAANSKGFCTQPNTFANSQNVLHTAKTFCTQQNGPYIERQLTPPTPPTPAGQPLTWGKVEEEMLDVGIVETEKPIEKMRETGCSPSDALAVIGFWRGHPGRWSQGKLRRRLINLRPHQRPDDLSYWQPPDQKTLGPTVPTEPEQIRELIEWVLSRDITDAQRTFWKDVLEDDGIRRPVASGFLARYREPLLAAFEQRRRCYRS